MSDEENKWTRDIIVTLCLKNFRVGKGRASKGDVDLPVNEEPHFLTSSFKGLLRGSMERACQVINLPTTILEDVLGRSVTSTAVEREGKIKISLISPKRLSDNPEINKVKLHGIRINQDFRSVRVGALFTHEAWFASDLQDSICLSFRITPLFPLNEQERVLLIAGINGLQWETFGGFGSRGEGLIEKIEVEPEEARLAVQQYLDGGK